MSIPMGTVSFSCADGGVEREAVGAEVVACEDGRAVVVIGRDDAAGVGVGDACQVRYTDPDDGRFMGVACVVESVDGERVALRVEGESRPANQRASFRVNTACAGITARVGRFDGCDVLDVSSAGIRVQVPSAIREGTSVAVRIDRDGEQIEGKFIVRRVGRTKGGIQVGLCADPRDSQLSGALTRLTSAMQREQLRRRSGVDGGTHKGEEDAPDPGADGAADPAIADAEGSAGGADAPEKGDGDAWVMVPASLLAGRALPGSLVSEEGSAIASRGQVLSMEEFQQLSGNGMYAGGDWSVGEGGEALPDGQEDRRRCARSGCDGVVRVVALMGEHVMEMGADLVNISRGGIGLRTPTMLEEDVYLAVDFSSGEDHCWVIGRVVYGAFGDGESTCRVGVEFAIDKPQTGPVPSSVEEFAEWVSLEAA